MLTLSFIRITLLDCVIHFGENLGDKVKGRSPKKLKSLIEVPYIVDEKVHDLSFNIILISSPQRVPTPSYQFRVNLGDHVNGRSQKNLKSLIEVPYVAHMKVQVLSFNMNLFSSLQRVLRPSFPFLEKFGRSGKMSFTEKAKIVDRGSICCAPESTVSKLQCNPFRFSVACSQPKLSISVGIWEIR